MKVLTLNRKLSVLAHWLNPHSHKSEQQESHTLTVAELKTEYELTAFLFTFCIQGLIPAVNAVKSEQCVD